MIVKFKVKQIVRVIAIVTPEDEFSGGDFRKTIGAKGVVTNNIGYTNDAESKWVVVKILRCGDVKIKTPQTFTYREEELELV